jgi:hypothetical protein
MLARRPATHCVRPIASIDPSLATMGEPGLGDGVEPDFVPGMEPLAATHKAAKPPPSQSTERIGTSPL